MDEYRNIKIHGLYKKNENKYEFFTSEDELNDYILLNVLNEEIYETIAIKYMGCCYNMCDTFVIFSDSFNPNFYTALTNNQYATYDYDNSTGKVDSWIAKKDEDSRVKKIYETFSKAGIIFKNDIYKLNKKGYEKRLINK